MSIHHPSHRDWRCRSARQGCAAFLILAVAGCASPDANLRTITAFGGAVGEAGGAYALSARTLGDLAQEAEYGRESYRYLSASTNAQCEGLHATPQAELRKARLVLGSLTRYLARLETYNEPSETAVTAGEMAQLVTETFKSANTLGIGASTGAAAAALIGDWIAKIDALQRAEHAAALARQMQPWIERIATLLKGRFARIDKNLDVQLTDWDECERAVLKLYRDDPSLTLIQQEARFRQYIEDRRKLATKIATVENSASTFDEVVKLHRAIYENAHSPKESIKALRDNIEKLTGLIDRTRQLGGPA